MQFGKRQSVAVQWWQGGMLMLQEHGEDDWPGGSAGSCTTCWLGCAVDERVCAACMVGCTTCEPGCTTCVPGCTTCVDWARRRRPAGTDVTPQYEPCEQQEPHIALTTCPWQVEQARRTRRKDSKWPIPKDIILQSNYRFRRSWHGQASCHDFSGNWFH